MDIESYLGVPLKDSTGRVLGHLAAFDERPMPPEPQRLFVFRIFAARAAAELDRLGMERMLQESETRYRDLFEEAPIPYVFEDAQTRFVSANRAAMKLLGLRTEDVPGTIGLSLVAPTPENQQRVRTAFEDIRQGNERGLVEVELRRKDDGRPVWVQFWSRPEPDGKRTRTMLIDITDRVLAEREKARLEQQNLYLQEEIKSSRDFDEIVGRSPALTAVLENVRRVAPTDACALISGETGTGKELIARAIHSLSKRRDKPLVKLNCAALPSGLIESELFGHEKGAFTGAIARRVGRFELADGGTVFLDEVGELPLDVQVKLLRVLQEREFDRVGGGIPQRVDVRVIAATNRDLAKAVRQQQFREDLFYRLNVFPIQLPALRDRREDIPLLAHYLLKKYAMQIGKPMDGLSPEAMERLQAYPWPGNVRELENVIELRSDPRQRSDCSNRGGDVAGVGRSRKSRAAISCGRDFAHEPARGRAKPHPGRAEADKRADRWTWRGRPRPGTPSQHVAEPDEETRDFPHISRYIVAISWWPRHVVSLLACNPQSLFGLQARCPMQVPIRQVVTSAANKVGHVRHANRIACLADLTLGDDQYRPC